MTGRIVEWDVPVDDRVHLIGSGPIVHVGSRNSPRSMGSWGSDRNGPNQVQVWTDERESRPGVPSTTRAVRVVGSGQEIPRSIAVVAVVGTTNVEGSGLVWHVIEVSA